MKEYWKEAESLVKDMFQKQGYTVLNQNDKGFPDLIVIKDGKISFFVEVKAMKKPDLSIYEMWYHQYLNKIGFEVKCINVLGEKMEEFQPDPNWSKVVKESNPLLTNR